MAIMNHASEENTVTKSASTPFAASAKKSHIWILPNLPEWLQAGILRKILQHCQAMPLRYFLKIAERIDRQIYVNRNFNSTYSLNGTQTVPEGAAKRLANRNP